VEGRGEDLGFALGVVEGSLKLEFGHSGYGGVVRENKGIPASSSTLSAMISSWALRRAGIRLVAASIK
jgi:hypothetical protein